MSGGWAGSTRKARLPDNWSELRLQRLAYDGYRCTYTEHGVRCPAGASDVDHHNPGDDHSLANLRSLCHGHHAVKSSREGGQAAAAKRKLARHPGERHPGLL